VLFLSFFYYFVVTAPADLAYGCVCAVLCLCYAEGRKAECCEINISAVLLVDSMSIYSGG
jgi:hypothetical protein